MKVFVVLGMLMLTGSGIACAQSGGRPLNGPVRDTSSPAKDTGRKATDSTARVLQAAVVTHRQPLIEQKIDRIVVNVNSLLSNAGSTLLDVMTNTPGLEVDDDGTVSLRGRAGVQVFIDGRPVRLSGTDLAAFLRSLPAGSIARLELMSTPPAGYEAAGTAGIVNIVTRKEGKKGLSGSLTGNISTGVYGSSANNGYLHYQQGGVSLNINAGYTVQNSYFLSDRLREYSLPDGTPDGSLQQHYYESSNRNGLYGKLDLTYTSPKKTEWNIMTEIYSSPYIERGQYRSLYFQAGGGLDSLQMVASRLSNRQETKHLLLGLRQPLGGSGGLVTTEWEIIPEGFTQAQFLATSVYSPENVLLDEDHLYPGQPSHVNSYSGKADYSRPLEKGGRLEGGWKSDRMQVDSRAAFADTFYAKGGDYSDSSWSDRFLYRETVHALYGSYSKEGRRWSVEAGLRGEYTLSQGHVPGGAYTKDSSFTRSYASLFPTLHFSYHPDSAGVNQVLLSGGRRIDRPGYWDLNPSVFFFDRSTVYIGNPYLLPEISYEGELSYIYRQHITASVQYSDTRNMSIRVFRQEGSLFVATLDNIGRTNTLELNAGATLPITGRWTGIFYNEWVYNRYHQSPAAAESINPGGQYWRVSVNNQFRMDRGWSAELSGFYKTAFRTVQSVFASQWYMNAALQKKLLQEKVVINLAAKDIFHTRITHIAFNNLPGQHVFFTNERDSRVISLTVTWRFGTTAAKKTPDARSEIEKLKNN